MSDQPNLASPAQVARLLAEIGVRPSRGRGQNFLIDRNILDLLLEAATLDRQDVVLEVGPGLGTVTQALLQRAGRVLAVEKDHLLCASLRDRLGSDPRFTLIEADMLEVSLDTLLGADPPAAGCKVVSNLPYAVGSRILVDLTRAARPPRSLVVMVQLEVAERMTTPAGGKAYGLLSVWLQRLYTVTLIKRVSPSCFLPKPDVWSAIVRLVRHDRHPLAPEEAACFHDLTRLCFAHRRKQLAAVLARAPAPLRCDPAWVQAWLAEEAGLDPRARPETLSPAQWCALTRALLASAAAPLCGSAE